jgi:energy-coupling factor transporter ATP-binding protein EcfA2
MPSTVSKITLKNFKFFHEETIKIKKNVLFYGENGSGKSSLYWALKIHFESLNGIMSEVERDTFFNAQNPKNLCNRNYLQDECSVIITPHDVASSKDTIHFINHQTLSQLFSSEIDGKIDFFDILSRDWFKKYTLFNTLQEKDLALDSPFNFQDKTTFDNDLKSLIEQLQDHTNTILQESFEEQLLHVELNYTDIFIEKKNLESPFVVTELPKIQILINQISNPQHHFNEAKLKLISLAIHFAIIKLSKPADYNGLRLAVFDDFLQSLDMSYRDVVLDYIFQNFQDYQIVMMTHDLQFYKLLKRKTEFYNVLNDWEYKNIHVRETIAEGVASIEPMVYDSKGSDNYMEIAKEALDTNDFETCGNNCRKELEKTIMNLAVDLQLGPRSQLKKFFELFMKREHNHFTHYYLDPQEVIKTLLEGEVEISTFKKVDLIQLRECLRKAEFYTNIVLNPSSHDDEGERYRREFESIIKNIEELKQIITPTSRGNR